MNKRITSLLLALVLCMGLVIPASAEPISAEGLRYTVVDGKTVQIDGVDPDRKAETIEIPSEIDGLPVTAIRENAFSQCRQGVKKIVVPNTVEKIGKWAFANMNDLEEAYIPSSVVEIGEYLFGGCNNLTKLTFEAKVTSIPENFIYSCKNLKEVSIPETVTTIGEWAFANCGTLKRLVIPNGVTSIGARAFSGCKQLNVIFTGNAPKFSTGAVGKDGAFKGQEQFYRGTAMAYYPKGDGTWTEEIMLDYGGKVVWEPYDIKNLSNMLSAPENVGGFKDVPVTSPYAEAISWALAEKIAYGKTVWTFAPNEVCTISNILSFLQRTRDASERHSDASTWGEKMGLIGNTNEGRYSCTRAMAVTYMWKLAGSPKPAKSASFTDVPANADYAQAVAWAVEKGITSGTSATTFSPDKACTRGQIITFMYRAHNAGLF